MAPFEPDERTALLGSGDGEIATINGSGNASVVNGESTSNGKKSSTGDLGGVRVESNDEEAAGSPEELENPLFEGRKDMMDKMGLLFPAVSIGILLSSMDQTLVISTYAKMGSDLNALNNTSWIATAYFLTLTSFQPLYGKLSDIFGRKGCLLFAYTVFGIGCLFCGLARNLNELVAARAFAGIGGGGMTTVVSILLSDIVPLRSRGMWQGYVNLVYALGSSIGAPLGGILADSIGWRWAFLGQFPLCIVASIAVYFLLQLPRTENSHWLSKLKKVDFLGAFTLVFAVFSLLVGMDRGSNVSWKSKFAIIPCCVSIPLFGLFILIETKIASHPFAPGHVIFHPSLVASYLTNFFGLAANIGSFFYVPLYLQAVEGLSPTAAGVRLVPVMLSSVAGSLFGGIYMQKTGRYYFLTIFLVFIGMLGAITIFLTSGILFTSAAGIILGLCISAFGIGASVTTTLLAVLANADPADQAIATACTYLFRSLGCVTGVSIASTVVQQRLRTTLREDLNGRDVEEIVRRVRENLDFIRTLDPELRVLVRGCYRKAVSTAFGAGVGIVVCALVAACFIREKRLSK